MKRIELLIEKKVVHKPFFTAKDEFIQLETHSYVMPKGYGDSIKAKVKIRYRMIEGIKPGKVYLQLNKGKTIRGRK